MGGGGDKKKDDGKSDRKRKFEELARRSTPYSRSRRIEREELMDEAEMSGVSRELKRSRLHGEKEEQEPGSSSFIPQDPQSSAPEQAGPLAPIAEELPPDDDDEALTPKAEDFPSEDDEPATPKAEEPQSEESRNLDEETANISDEIEKPSFPFGSPEEAHSLEEAQQASEKPTQVNMERNQSPIDILPMYTAYDPTLENAVFRFDYDGTAEMRLTNVGSTLELKYPPGASSDFGVSFIDGEEYHLDTVTFHWDNEIMNGSEHTVGGVGYAGEMHFIHRNLKYASMETAVKQPNGALAVAVFLNESHSENPYLTPITNLLHKLKHNGDNEPVSGLQFSQLLPGLEKQREFWVYDGSETIAPFREDVKWIVFRSAMQINTAQLEQLRQLCQNRHEDEHDVLMKPKREVQNQNGRIVRASFKGAGTAELPS